MLLFALPIFGSMQELVAMRLIFIEIINQLYTIINASLFLSAHIQPPSAIFFIGYKISEKKLHWESLLSKIIINPSLTLV